MKKIQFKNIIKNPFSRDMKMMGIVVCSVLLNIALYIYIVIQFSESPDSIIFHYNVNTGILLDAPASAIYRIPAIGTFLLILNTIIAMFIYQQKKIIAYVIISMTALFQVFLLLSIIALDRVNF